MEIISRKHALSKNLKKYFTGKPCKHGHICERITTNRTCIICYKKTLKKSNKKNQKRYREENKERLQEYQKEYYNKNKKQLQQQHEEYQKNNKEKLQEYRKEYRAENKEYIQKYQRVYRKQYRKENIEKIKESAKKWRKKHPDRVSKYTREYLCYKEQSIPLWYENDLIKQLYIKRDELSKLWKIKLHVDHIIPLQGKNVCGLHCWDNLQLLEASLNQSKGNRLLPINFQ